MTKEELGEFINDHFGCLCGRPEDACASLLRLLELHPLYDHLDEVDAWIADSGVKYLLLYMLDKWDLTEHGGGVGGAWLSPLGIEVRDALRAIAPDFEFD